MAAIPLRLVNDDTEASMTRDVFRFEQRRAVRHSVSGRVTAVSRGDASDGVRSRICSFQLKDMSDTGVGVFSQEDVALNTSVTMFFPPHGAESGFDATGRVVRSRLTDQGHELGIRFDGTPAA